MPDLSVVPDPDHNNGASPDAVYIPKTADEHALAEYLAKLSDGRAWNPNVVISEINGHVQTAMVAYYEAGKRLLWAKHVIGHGGFEAWIEDNFPFSYRTARKWMQVARWMLEHPEARKVTGGLTLKKTLLLTQLPPELSQHLEETGGLPELAEGDLETMSYPDLKRRVEELKAEVEGLEESRRLTQNELERKDRRIAELAGDPVGTDEDVIAALDGMHDRMQEVLAVYGTKLQNLALNFDEWGDAAQIKFIQMCDYYATAGERTRNRALVAAGLEGQGILIAGTRRYQATGNPHALPGGLGPFDVDELEG